MYEPMEKRASNRRRLMFEVTPAVMKALRMMAKDTREDVETPANPAVVAMMTPEIAAQLLEGAVIDAIRERYDKALGEL